MEARVGIGPKTTAFDHKNAKYSSLIKHIHGVLARA